jgi:hypothetical protein
MAIIVAFSKPSAFAGCRFRFRAYTVAMPALPGHVEVERSYGESANAREEPLIGLAMISVNSRRLTDHFGL